MIVTTYDMFTYLGRFSFEIHDESVKRVHLLNEGNIIMLYMDLFVI